MTGDPDLNSLRMARRKERGEIPFLTMMMRVNKTNRRANLYATLAIEASLILAVDFFLFRRRVDPKIEHIKSDGGTG